MNELFSIGLAVLSSLFAALGQVGLKFGSMKLEKKFIAILKNYALLSGLFFYGLSSIVFILALRGHELTVLYPIASLNYVWVSLLSMKLLKEKMNAYKWLGILLIIIGVTFVV
jgi:multidrug transporter EmrE-like cation transporter